LRHLNKQYKEYYDYTTKVFDNIKNNQLLEIQNKYDFEKLKTSKKESEVKLFKLLTILSFVLLSSVIIIFIVYLMYARNKKILLQTEQEVEKLQKTADHYAKKNHNILQKLVGIFGKTALLAIDISNSKQDSEKKMLTKFNKIVFTQEQWDWEILYQTMNDDSNGLYEKIRIKYPQLSEQEFRICCLTCEKGFTDKEIEKIIGGNINSIRKTRSELRKEFGMAERENFFVFFEKEFL